MIKPDGSREIIRECKRQSEASGTPFPEEKAICATSYDVGYIMQCMDKTAKVIHRGKKQSTLTERHLDVVLFGDILDPLQPWVYREISSRVSKKMRKDTPGKAGYLIDYLRTVCFPSELPLIV